MEASFRVGTFSQGARGVSPLEWNAAGAAPASQASTHDFECVERSMTATYRGLGLCPAAS
jgi:hypothetical protein